MIMRNVVRHGVVCACLAGLAGCGLFDDDDRLSGERIKLRDQRVAAATEQPTGEQMPIPQAVRNPDWTQTNGRANHASGHLDGPAAPNEVWSRDIGSGSSDEAAITSAPIVVGGRVYVLDAESQLVALDAANGAEVWETDLAPEGESGEEGFGGGIASDGNQIYAATGFGELLAISAADGEILWRFKAAAPYRSAPAVAGGILIAVNRENRAVGLDTRSGSPLWRLDGISAGAGMLGGASPAIQGALAVLPFGSGEVIGIQARSGRRIWSAVLGGARRGLARGSISDVTGDPVIAGQAVVVGNQAGRIVAIDGASGQRGWTRSVGAAGPIWAAGSSIFLVSDDARLTRLALQNGRTLWETQLPAFEDEEDRDGPITYSGPVLAGGRLYVTDTESNLLSFDPLTGEAGAVLDLSDGSVTGAVVADATIFVLSDNGVLQAFR